MITVAAAHVEPSHHDHRIASIKTMFYTGEGMDRSSDRRCKDGLGGGAVGYLESTDPLVGTLGSPIAFGRAVGGAGHCAQQLIGGLAVVEGTVALAGKVWDVAKIRIFGHEP
jgi:hypothetical protein